MNTRMSFAPTRCLLAVLSLSALAGCASSVSPGGGSDAIGADQIAASDATDVSVHTDARPVIDTGLMSAASITCGADAGVEFPASLTFCNVSSDCVAVAHGLDCCGSTEMVGINIAQQMAYAVPEQACESQVHYNMCDCAARAPVTQDGHTIPAGATAGVNCVGGVCLTHSAP